MKTVLFTLLTIIGFSSVYSQSYNFSTRTETYTELTSPTSLNNGSTWDSPNYSVPIGFDFQLFDTIVNELILFAEGGGGEVAVRRGTSDNYHVITAVGNDIIDRGNNSGISESDIAYELTGGSGSHILKIQWKNAGFWLDLKGDFISTDYLNFQLWLYEGSNKIEIHFGPNSVEKSSLGGANGYYIGIYKNVYNLFWIDGGVEIIGDPDNPTKVDSQMYLTSSLNSISLDGRVYSFSLSLVSVDTEVNNDSFTTTPNPSNGLLFLNYNTTLNNITVKVIDVLGKELDVFDIETKKVDLSNYKSGIYTVILESDKGVLTRKIIKE